MKGTSQMKEHFQDSAECVQSEEERVFAVKIVGQQILCRCALQNAFKSTIQQCNEKTFRNEQEL
jgi:hypothetical protein